MGKKKGSKEKGRGAEKAAQKVVKKSKKDEGMEDLEALIAEFQLIDKKKTEVYEEKCSLPSARINLTATLHPDKEEIILFGGEYFNGHKTYVYNDLFVFNIKKAEWSQLFVPDPPPPRCAHQAVAVSSEGGQLWIFGGEFASPTHSKFYHYKDLWVLKLQEKKWEKINAPGGPSPRSGHRMVKYKKQLIVFGGFYESSNDYIYFNDCYTFDLTEYKWTKINPPGNGPSPRSGCNLLPLSNGILVVGGYSKVKVKKDVDKGTPHTDMFMLEPEVVQGGKITSAILKWKWSRVKDSGAKPSPRSAYGMTILGGNRAVMFGGVHDEDDEEDMDSVFYNSMHCLDLDSFRWFPFDLRKQKQKKSMKKDLKPSENTESGGTENEIDTDNTKNMTEDTSDEKTVVWVPCGRMNPLLIASHGMLYLYGGAYEEDEKQITLNDLWSLNLKTMDTWKQLFEADNTYGDWKESESDSSEDEENKEDEATGGMVDSTEKEISAAENSTVSSICTEGKQSKPKTNHPKVSLSESYMDYWQRTSDHWLEIMRQEADKDVPADKINHAAKDMSAAWHKIQTKKNEKKLLKTNW